MNQHQNINVKQHVPERFIPANYQRCAISLMDNIADPNIRYDEKGICNYYYGYLTAESLAVLPVEQRLYACDKIISEIKQQGEGKKYDCILGVSGGVDSTFLALKAREFGLRILCVHFDNGWNSELAVANIESIVKRCGFDLYTYVINWPEFRDIQLSFFKANVVDIEAVTDIAIFAALDTICKERGIKYIIDGRNVVTEEVLPKAWIYKDQTNLLDIHRHFGTLKIKSYPVISYRTRKWNEITKPFKSVPLLNYIDYNKADAKKAIIEQLGWRDYGGKHYESVFTRFYQGYILPNKFGIDKRKAHLSNLIYSGQMTLEEALIEMEQPIYPPELLEQDMQFALKKLGFSQKEFKEYIQTPARSHFEFATRQTVYSRYPYLKVLQPLAGAIFRRR